MDHLIWYNIAIGYLKQFDLSKYEKSNGGMIKFINDNPNYAKVITEKVREFNLNNNPVKPEKVINDLKKIKKTYINDGVELDADFGKLNKNKLAIQKKALEEAEKTTLITAQKYLNSRIYCPNIKDRSTEAILAAICPNDPDLMGQFYEVFGHKNDEIEPISGKNYGDLKAKYFVEGFKKIDSVLQEYTQYKSEEEMLEFNSKYLDILVGITEIDEKKLPDFINNMGFNSGTIAKEYPEFSKKIDYVSNNISSYVSFGSYRNMIGLMCNPLYPYGSNNDLSYLTEVVAVDQTGYQYITGLKANDKYEVNLVGEFSTVSSAFDYEKLGANHTAPYQTKEYLKWFIAPATSTSLENMRFFDGDQEIELKDRSNKELDKLGQMLADGKTITIKDKSGKFLFSYETDREHFMMPNCAEYAFNMQKTLDDTFEKEIKNYDFKMGDFKKDVGVAISDMKQDIKASAEMINEKLSKSIEKEIDDKLTKMAKLLDVHGPEKERKKDESYYYDIKDMLKDVVGKTDKNGQKVEFHKDKDTYINSLKSIKTFCQAYLDEKTGAKMDKKEQSKYKAINTVYQSLVNVEKQINDVKAYENNLVDDLQLKAKKDNPEYIKAFNNKEVERPILFDEMSKEEQEKKLAEMGIIEKDKAQEKNVKAAEKEKVVEKQVEKEIIK